MALATPVFLLGGYTLVGAASILVSLAVIPVPLLLALVGVPIVLSGGLTRRWLPAAPRSS
jgi:hypothetical protein